MEREIDVYSYQCGVMDAFCEMVHAGVKRIALSHPFPTREEDIAAYRAIGEEKARLLADGAYRGAARERLAVDFGRLLGYREDDIARLMAENSDREP